MNKNMEAGQQAAPAKKNKKFRNIAIVVGCLALVWVVTHYAGNDTSVTQRMTEGTGSETSEQADGSVKGADPLCNEFVAAFNENGDYKITNCSIGDKEEKLEGTVEPYNGFIEIGNFTNSSSNCFAFRISSKYSNDEGGYDKKDNEHLQAMIPIVVPILDPNVSQEELDEVCKEMEKGGLTGRELGSLEIFYKPVTSSADNPMMPGGYIEVKAYDYGQDR